MEVGFEDIYSCKPYIDSENEGKRVLLHMLYVPPIQRGKGKGKKLFKEFLDNLPKEVEFIRLKSAALGSGCTMAFWQSLGFTSAYIGGDPNCESCILHLAVNRFSLPDVEELEKGEVRHYIFD